MESAVDVGWYRLEYFNCKMTFSIQLSATILDVYKDLTDDCS